ncbi:outer dynein arm-docking complex subunit 3 [Thraustotheca clavata]|uniref:Outer dynein arm-docking complex subunit 3 n=1 Tax=Thraustotheca clavata TaxID=74557 RepID=A0A1W0AAH0_9STRA|nr:outer dynein arm-docking complex subunit 3 [Thraustotheca clavata]
MADDGDAKGMIAQEERELRRVFDHLAGYRTKKKLSQGITALKERKGQLEYSNTNFTSNTAPIFDAAGKKMTQPEIVAELHEVDGLIEKHNADLAALQASSTVRVIKSEDLFDAIKALGKVCSKKEISDMIWEADENLDGSVDWEELRGMFNRNLLDKTELEPVNLFNVVQFMTYDKKLCGTITADDTMAILFARYGQAQLETKMKTLFGDSDELSFVNYLDRVGKQRNPKKASNS